MSQVKLMKYNVKKIKEKEISYSVYANSEKRQIGKKN